MKKLVAFALLTFSAVCATGGVEAFGVRGGLGSSPDQLILGGHAQVYDLSPEAKIIPNVELGFGDNITVYSFNAAVHYSFLSSNMNGFTPYAGGELGFNMWSWDLREGASAAFDDSETKLVLNGVAGLKKKLNDRQELTLELKLGLSDWAHDFKVLAGLTFF